MSKIGSQSGFTGTSSKRQACISLERASGLLVLTLLLALCPAQAAEPNDQYLQIYTLILQADDLNTSGKTAPAKAKYEEAQTALGKFQKSYPRWNVKLVSYRLNYVAQKLAALSETPPAAAGGGTATNAPDAQPDTRASTSTSAQPGRLLEAGAEPRSVLRLHPSRGDKQTLRVTMNMAMETKMGEVQSPAMKLPAMTMTMDVTVKDVSDKGDIAYELVMGDTSIADEPGAMAQAVEAIKAALAGAKGMSATGTMSSRGFSKVTQFKVPPGANPQARQLMDQMKDSLSQLAAPLPEEAVGPGAKWEVRMPIKSQGMTIHQTAVCELVTLEGERLTIRRTVTQRASNQKIENPAMPGMKVDLAKMTGKGTGELSLDLGKLLPSAGTTDFHSETAMGINMGGQKQAITMTMDLHLHLETK